MRARLAPRIASDEHRAISLHCAFSLFAERGIAGRDHPAGSDGARGLALPRAEDTGGRVRRRRAPETRARLGDLQRGRETAGLPEHQRAQHAPRGLRVQQRVPGEPRLPEHTWHPKRLDIEMQTRGDKAERVLVAPVDRDKGSAVLGTLQQRLQVRGASTRTTRTSDQGSTRWTASHFCSYATTMTVERLAHGN